MPKRIVNAHSKTSSRRIAFPDFEWFDLSSALYEDGLVAQMTGADFKRYATLRYLANKKHANPIQVGLADLEKLDGICPRRAHEVNPHLEEMRTVEINRQTNPYCYRLYMPTEWRRRTYSPAEEVCH